MKPRNEGIFSRLANWYNKGMKAASVYAPMISQQLRSPLGQLLLGGRASAAADLIDRVANKLPAIDKTIKGTAASFRSLKNEI